MHAYTNYVTATVSDYREILQIYAYFRLYMIYDKIQIMSDIALIITTI